MHSSCVGVGASKGLASSLASLSTSNWSKWQQSVCTEPLTAGRYCSGAKLLMKQLMVLLNVLNSYNRTHMPAKLNQ